jgi:anti-sigma factor RsiW
MTATWDCQEARIALGVYVLGAIDPGERAAVDAHLDTCPECRAELAEFMDLPGLLALVPSDEAIALADGPLPGDPPLLPPVAFLARPRDAAPLDAISQETRPMEVLPFPVPAQAEPPAEAGATAPGPRPANVVDLAAARRRRRGLASIAAVAAAAVVIGGASFGGAKLAASPAPAAVSQGLTQPDQLHPAGAPNGVWQTVTGRNGQATATVAFQSMRWGTQLEAKVSGLPVNTPCQMWVVESDGTRALAGSWVTDSDEGTVWYPASAGASATDIKSFVITVQGGQPITVTA